MAAIHRVIPVLVVLALAGCTAPENESQDPTPTGPTTATRQPTTLATPTPTSALATPTPATTRVTPTTPTPATPGGNDTGRVLAGVEAEAMYADLWDADIIVPKLQDAGFTVIESSERGARLRYGGNNTTIEVEPTTDGAALRMRFESEPVRFEGDGDDLEKQVDEQVGAAMPHFEEAANAFEQATGWIRNDTRWVPLIRAA